MSDIYSMLDTYARHWRRTPEYVDQMIHAIPDAPVVDRVAFIVERCKGKRVVNFGSSSGQLHQWIKDAAASVYGVDKNGAPDLRVDLDDENYSLFNMPTSDVYVCGEIIEHLLAPGFFLRKLRRVMELEGAENCQLIVTVPNAFSSIQQNYGKGGEENVNADHVAWYSYITLKNLLHRCGFSVKELAWYNGKPVFAEGLIMVAQ